MEGWGGAFLHSASAKAAHFEPVPRVWIDSIADTAQSGGSAVWRDSTIIITLILITHK